MCDRIAMRKAMNLSAGRIKPHVNIFAPSSVRASGPFGGLEPYFVNCRKNLQGTFA